VGGLDDPRAGVAVAGLDLEAEALRVAAHYFA
jgi:hypothetical protein